jgi:hypothetical protein
MLNPDVRRLYSECFAAPTGHAFDGAIGTTFSLDLDSLLFATFCLATSGSDEPDAALEDPVSLLEAIHRIGERMTVFCHAGETNAPARPQVLYGLLEHCLVPARGRGGALFHPKLWLLRFRSRAGDESLLRAVILSRNLTSSRAWDAFVCLEGSPGQEKHEESLELAELVRALPDLRVPGHTLPRARLALIVSLARDAESTRFEAPPPFQGVASFRALGIGDGRRFEPAERGERLLAISPFVSPDTLSALRTLAPRAQLIGREEEMGKCPAEAIAVWDAFTLDEGASSSAAKMDDTASLDASDEAPNGLHAKALVIETGQRTTWWLGSGNLTDPVRSGASVELMVRLEGKKSQVGIDCFWDAGFGSLLVPYKHQGVGQDPTDGSRSAVNRAKHQMAEAALSLRCEPVGELWDLVLMGAFPKLDGVTAACRPVSLAPHRELALDSDVDQLRFVRLTPEALTAFSSVRLTAGSGESRFELSFALKLPITGLPADRDARITRAIIKDRAAFMSYLHCLLSDAGSTVGDAQAMQRGRDPWSADLPTAAFAQGLLEPMLRTLHQDPERLRGVRALLERGDTDSSEGSIIPTEFRELWAAVEPHLPGKQRATP